MSRQGFIVVGLCCVGLSACNTMNDERAYVYETSAGYYEGAYIDSSLFQSPSYFYNSSYSTYPENQNIPDDSRGVIVPETYHVGSHHGPVSAKDRDRTWVLEQNPEAYTIEIADDHKASQVAKQLYQAPKKERMAEVPYFRNGRQYYKGLYGSYSTYEEAKQALQGLPEHLKQQSGVKRWRDVQGVIGENSYLPF